METQRKASAIALPLVCVNLLPGQQFADAYGIAAPEGMDAIAAMQKIFAGTPRWITALMSVRNALVGVGGLKTAPISQFPVIRQSADEVLVGFDDQHLDFRIRLAISADRQISICTAVRTHNRFGRFYLGCVLPFHRIISRRMLEQVWK